MTLNIITYHPWFYFKLASHNDYFGVFSWCCISDVTAEIYSSDVTFNIASDLSQPIGKTDCSSTAKNRTNSVPKVRKMKSQKVSSYPVDGRGNVLNNE